MLWYVQNVMEKTCVFGLNRPWYLVSLCVGSSNWKFRHSNWKFEFELEISTSSNWKFRHSNWKFRVGTGNFHFVQLEILSLNCKFRHPNWKFRVAFQARMWHQYAFVVFIYPQQNFRSRKKRASLPKTRVFFCCGQISCLTWAQQPIKNQHQILWCGYQHVITSRPITALVFMRRPATEKTVRLWCE